MNLLYAKGKVRRAWYLVDTPDLPGWPRYRSQRSLCKYLWQTGLECLVESSTNPIKKKVAQFVVTRPPLATRGTGIRPHQQQQAMLGSKTDGAKACRRPTQRNVRGILIRSVIDDLARSRSRRTADVIPDGYCMCRRERRAPR